MGSEFLGEASEDIRGTQDSRRGEKTLRLGTDVLEGFVGQGIPANCLLIGELGGLEPMLCDMGTEDFMNTFL